MHVICAALFHLIDMPPFAIINPVSDISSLFLSPDIVAGRIGFLVVEISDIAVKKTSFTENMKALYDPRLLKNT